jgi:hypothetical protein
VRNGKPLNRFGKEESSSPTPRGLQGDTFPLMIVVFVLADFVANKWKMPVLLRVRYNILILLTVTAAVDVILWHEWKSWNW